MKKYQLSQLVLDFDLYPRGGVDSHHVTEIAAAIEAGAKIPQMVIDKPSKRIVDGFHRWKAYRRLFGEQYEVECIEKSYHNDGEILLDAMRYNASHGRALTQHDKTHCLLLAEKLKLKVELVADALNLTPERVTGLVPRRVAHIGQMRVPLKQTIKHMVGKRLTKGQVSANEKLSGMNQLFYVNQLITLLENNLIDSSNDDLITGLSNLQKMLEGFLRKAA